MAVLRSRPCILPGPASFHSLPLPLLVWPLSDQSYHLLMARLQVVRREAPTAGAPGSSDLPGRNSRHLERIMQERFAYIVSRQSLNTLNASSLGLHNLLQFRSSGPRSVIRYSNCGVTIMDHHSTSCRSYSYSLLFWFVRASVSNISQE